MSVKLSICICTYQRVLLTVGRKEREDYYIVAGEGDDRARLQNFVNVCGLAERVRLVGALDQAALVDAYPMADLFVMPSGDDPGSDGLRHASAWLRRPRAVGALADGKLGTMASGADFVPGLVPLLATPKPDPLALTDAVRSRFGYTAFSRQFSSILARILRARGRPIAPARTQPA
jgi:glycosyltransferase involved in cell wall biosynthesis